MAERIDLAILEITTNVKGGKEMERVLASIDRELQTAEKIRCLWTVLAAFYCSGNCAKLTNVRLLKSFWPGLISWRTGCTN